MIKAAVRENTKLQIIPKLNWIQRCMRKDTCGECTPVQTKNSLNSTRLLITRWFPGSTAKYEGKNF